jgi:hypothetical protein
MSGTQVGLCQAKCKFVIQNTRLPLVKIKV